MSSQKTGQAPLPLIPNPPPMNSKAASKSHRPARTAGKIVLWYLGLSLFWGFFAERIVQLAFHQTGVPLLFQNGKDLFFVAASALVLFFLIAKEIKRLGKAEEDLRTSEQYLASIFRAAPTGIGVVVDRVMVTVNDRICSMTGYPPEELIGRDARLLYADENEYERVGTEKYKHIRQDGTGMIETSWQRKDGRLIDVQLCSTPIDPYDLSAGVTFTALDITASKRAKAALRESEEKFALAFTSSPDAFNISRLEDGLFVEINRGFTDLTGFTAEDVRGKTSLDINVWHNPADRQALIMGLREKGCCENLEAVFRRKDGSLATGLMSARTISLNDVPHIISITRDITGRKDYEARLERLQVAIEQAGEVIVVTDAEGNIQYANPAFEKATGYSFEEAYQRNPRFLKSGEHDQAFYKDLWQTVSHGRTWSGRMVNKKKDGTLYTEEATISPVFDAHRNIISYVAIKRDITAQLRLEAQYMQAQKMESVGRLTGGVAHDFNNILAVIIGYCEIAMAQTGSAGKVYQSLERILEAANRSADIIRQLLAFSRKQTISPKVLDLNHTVQGLLKMLQRLIGEDIDLTWLPAPDLAPIRMDPAQIDQILVNLCVNARDAIDGTGKVTMTTRMVWLDAAACADKVNFVPGRYAVLSFSDNGCGMANDVVANIFEPFFTTKGRLGTGLGLATVYGIVTQNHGFIDVASKPGHGTTFQLYLPIDETLAVWDKEAPHQPPQRGRGETILMVEDDSAILAMGRAILEDLNYRIVTAASPEEALRLTGTHAGAIDLLLTDVIMPGMNGKELSQRLLALKPALKIIYMSGYSADLIAHHGVLDEDMHFLQKPFTASEMAARIREVLDGGGAQ